VSIAKILYTQQVPFLELNLTDGDILPSLLKAQDGEGKGKIAPVL
jgi:hypothetical protein